MFSLIKKKKKKKILLLSSIVSVSNHTKCASLSNQKYMTQPTLINLNPNECCHKLHYYLFAFNVLEVAILLITYLIEYVFQIKQKI